jgi:TrmH family RNA methyltransferase
VIRDVAGRQNHSVKLARKLQHKKHRRDRGLILCEGMDLLVAAVEASAQIRDVLVRKDLVGNLPETLVELADGDLGDERLPDIGICEAATLQYASSLGGAADVVFTCAQPHWNLTDLPLERGASFFLDGVGDPGNVGTLVRSALAFGWVGVMCSVGTADPYCPKAMRAGMGAQFSLPIVAEVLPEDLSRRMAALKREGSGVPEVLVADAHEGVDVREALGSQGIVVVLGSERRGPADGWQGAAKISIPQERFESLNVGMAGTVIAYEAWRNRQRGSVGN